MLAAWRPRCREACIGLLERLPNMVSGSLQVLNSTAASRTHIFHIRAANNPMPRDGRRSTGRAKRLLAYPCAMFVERFETGIQTGRDSVQRAPYVHMPLPVRDKPDHAQP
jgi:hypothetical protein